MSRRSFRSLSLPIIAGTITIPLTVAMLVAWILVVYQNRELSASVTGQTWLLVLGIVSMSIILFVLVLLSVYLVREILKVQRQVRFIDSVTHELKSPLASLKMLLATQARDGLSNAQVGEIRRMMEADIDRLATFIDDVLRVSGAGGNVESQDVDQFSLKQLAESCADRVARRHEADRRGIHVEVPESLELSTDRSIVEAIVNNLVDNAVKYSDAPITVMFRAVLEPKHLILEVSDHGIGLAPGDRKRIFDRFYRVPNERVRATAGTGLGLFVVSGLVKRLGGRLQATSLGPGQGATVRVRLPRGRVMSTDAEKPGEAM